MTKKFESSIEVETIKIDTVVDHPYIEHGINLSGTIYINGVHDDKSINNIKLEVFKVTGEVTSKMVSKHSIELVGAVASKDMQMIPFEIMPDERWIPDADQEMSKLILRTTVLFENGSEFTDEDEINFDIDE
ncbi:sporulation-control protein [Psychrobacillus insolitus]|uniref:Sporulation-control protein n=1 Tax=Psychrobacillus insolitus TaxID=1461 RepID=A0A2W7MLA9_9BACI|nr:sporulation protein [Psychrobacillus insolitus]PZX07550.1 sporulation-control protein [Psychrobacillus insolitus]